MTPSCRVWLKHAPRRINKNYVRVLSFNVIKKTNIKSLGFCCLSGVQEAAGWLSAFVVSDLGVGLVRSVAQHGTRWTHAAQQATPTRVQTTPTGHDTPADDL